MKKPCPPSAARSTGRKRRADERRIAEAVAALDELEATASKGKAIIAMLKSWLEDDSGYDEETWPPLKRALDERRRPKNPCESDRRG